MSMPSKREFLNSNINPATGEPYAGLTRGRFSSAAEAFAAANADKWSESAPAPKSTPKAAAPRPVPGPRPTVSQASAPVVRTGTINPKDVRAWARQNGHEVQERGRLTEAVVKAYLAAGGKVTAPAAARPSPAVMPKVRGERTAWGVVKPQTGEGSWAREFVIGASSCSLGHPIQSCTCTTMMSKRMGPVPSVPLSLTKPVV